MKAEDFLICPTTIRLFLCINVIFLLWIVNIWIHIIRSQKQVYNITPIFSSSAGSKAPKLNRRIKNIAYVQLGMRGRGVYCNTWNLDVGFQKRPLQPNITKS